MKVYYIKDDRAVVVFKGEFKDCLKFYISNKAKYREDKKFIQIGEL